MTLYSNANRHFWSFNNCRLKLSSQRPPQQIYLSQTEKNKYGNGYYNIINCFLFFVVAGVGGGLLPVSVKYGDDITNLVCELLRITHCCSWSPLWLASRIWICLISVADPCSDTFFVQDPQPTCGWYCNYADLTFVTFSGRERIIWCYYQFETGQYTQALGFYDLWLRANTKLAMASE